MGCDDIRDLLALHAGGETHDNERIAVESHVSGCPECGRELQEYRDLRGNLGGLKEGQAPRGAIEGIWTAVEERIGAARRPRVRFGEWAVRVAAVLVIGVAIGYSTMQVVRPAAATPAAADSEAVSSNPSVETGGPVRNAGGMTPYIDFSPKSTRPRRSITGVEGNFYLPRVEKILDGDETDF